MSINFTRKALHQLLTQSALAVRVVSQSDPVILHAKLQLIVLSSFKANANTSTAIVGKGVLDCVRDKLVDNKAYRGGLMRAQRQVVRLALDRDLPSAR